MKTEFKDIVKETSYFITFIAAMDEIVSSA